MKVMSTVNGPDTTVSVPLEAPETGKPLMNPISQLYVPAATWKLIVLAPEPAVPGWNTPPNDRPHAVPLVRPVSWNVIVYVTGVNTTPTDTDYEVTVSGELGLEDASV